MLITFSLFHLMTYPFSFFFFNAPPTTEIYTLSLHDALPIWWDKQLLWRSSPVRWDRDGNKYASADQWRDGQLDRKSTRLNSSHITISYAVFCLKKKKKNKYKQS